jgi:hypothetical protein
MGRASATMRLPDAEGARGRARRRVLRALAAALTSVAVAALGWLGYNETFLASAREVQGGSLTVRAQLGVPRSDVDAALAALRAADRYLVDVLSEAPPRDVDLKLATFSRCVPYVPLREMGSAVADADELCINTRYQAWPAVRTDPAKATVLLAHERFHNVQGQAGCLPGPADHEYAWWVEGSATYVGFKAAVAADLLTPRGAEDALTSWLAEGPPPGPLSSYERQIGGDAAYAMAAQAVAELVSSNGASSLMAFCRAVGSGVDWETAFQDAYGLTPEAFYRSRG